MAPGTVKAPICPAVANSAVVLTEPAFHKPLNDPVAEVNWQANALTLKPGNPVEPDKGVGGINPDAVLIILEATKCMSSTLVNFILLFEYTS